MVLELTGMIVAGQLGDAFHESVTVSGPPASRCKINSGTMVLVFTGPRKIAAPNAAPARAALSKTGLHVR